MQSLNLSPSSRILQLNVEGISLAKSDVISKLAEEEDVQVIFLQETHTRTEENLLSRCKVQGFKIVGSICHERYGIATLIRSEISEFQVVYKDDKDDVEVLTIQLGGLYLTNIYKPPKKSWPSPPLPYFPGDSMYVGDFNSHHHEWGYAHNDENGNKILEWMNAYHG